MHPAQLYEAVFDFALFYFLFRRYRGKHFNGQVSALYFAIYAVFRFALEYVRANPAWMALTYNQWISLAVFASALLLYGFARGKAEAYHHA